MAIPPAAAAATTPAENATAGIESQVDRLDAILPDTPLVVHFWATWCVPCRAELPELAEFRGSLPAELSARLVVASVDKRPRADVLDFLSSEMELPEFQTWLVDPAEAGSRFRIKGYPLTLFLSADGTVIRRISGEAPWASETFQAKVIDHLSQAH